MSRENVITDRLTKTCADIDITCVTETIEEWTATPDASAQWEWGFIPATAERDWELRICPSLIAQHTEDLDDTTFEEYLDALCALVGLHIVHAGAEDPDRAVEAALWEVAPASLSLLSQVQLSVLDTHSA